MTGNRSEMVLKPGDTFIKDGDDYWTAGIDIGEHGNAIECYRSTEAEANALRDKILDALRAPNQPLSDSVVERVAAILELPENEFTTDEPLSLQRAYRILAAIPSAGGVETQESLGALSGSRPSDEAATASSPYGFDPARGSAFQNRVGAWMEACFTPKIIADKLERADRFIEEALELVQATGYSPERAHALVEYVFNRPVGVAFQEVGGVMVTLAALCNPHDINMDGAAETELARVWTKIDKIRAKQATKPVGSALPVPPESVGQ